MPCNYPLHNSITDMQTTIESLQDFIVTVEHKAVTRVVVPAMSEDHAINKVRRYGVEQYNEYEGYSSPSGVSVKARLAPPPTMKQLRAKYGKQAN